MDACRGGKGDILELQRRVIDVVKEGNEIAGVTKEGARGRVVMVPGSWIQGFEFLGCLGFL